MAALPGAAPEAASTAARAALGRLGRAVGSAIYWADALDDLERDYLAGDFNPCVVRRPLGWTAGALPAIAPERVAETSRLLEGAMREMADALAALPVRRHQTLLANILCDRFPALARRLVARAARTASPKERNRLSAWLGMPWYGRLAARMVLLVTLVGTWLGGVRTLWARPATPPTATAAGADAGAPSEASATPPANASAGPPGEPSAAPRPGPAPGPGSTGDPGSTDDRAGGSGKGTGSGGGGWPAPCDGCAPDKCCDCQGWIDGCCNRCCKQPCDDCLGRCCDPCKGCKDCGCCCK
jgi:hypothetical protein